MKVITGQMFAEDKRQGIAILATTNGTIYQGKDKKPLLITGGGAARDMAVAAPHTPRVFADNIMTGKNCPYGTEYLGKGIYRYGLVLDFDMPPNAKPGWFHEPVYGGLQTKEDVSKDSTGEMIERAVKALHCAIETHPNIHTWKINYPAIGLGGLKREDVEPLLTSLPDSVEFYLLPMKPRGR